MKLRRWSEALADAVRLPVPVVLMTLIVMFVCFFGLNHTALIDQVDEGLYASTARRMIDSGDWVTPRFGPNVFLDKPPLSFWCQAVFIRLLGPTPLAARLPSAIAACLTALALYYWARRKGLARVGWLAALLYILCPLVALGLARVAMVDSLLTLWLTLAVMGWIEGYGGRREGYLLMAACAGLAVMTKGAIGFLLPCLSFGVWLIVRRDWAALRGVPWGAALAIFLLLTLPWHLAAWWANGNLFFDEYIMRRHVMRFLGRDFGHNEPFWYYVPLMASNMFPWSVFVPVAWWKGLRSWRGERQSLEAMMAMWGVWAAIVVLFFSASVSKLPNYILPALPALMLLLAWRLDAIWHTRGGLTTVETVVLGVAGSLLGGLCLTVGVYGWRWRTPPASPPWLAKKLGALFSWKERTESADLLWLKLTTVTGPALHWIVLGAIVLFASIVILAVRKNTARTISSATVLSLALTVLSVHIVLPAWSSYDVAPLNALGQRTLPALERGETLVMYALHPKRPSLNYMLGHDEQIVATFSPDVLRSVLTDKEHGYVLTTNGASLPALPGSLRQEATAGGWTLWRYDK